MPRAATARQRARIDADHARGFAVLRHLAHGLAGARVVEDRPQRDEGGDAQTQRVQAQQRHLDAGEGYLVAASASRIAAGSVLPARRIASSSTWVASYDSQLTRIGGS
jgi:hypothetical protein